jgi:hypothetical protein
VAKTRSPAHGRALDTSSVLTGYYYEMYGPGKNMVSPKKVVELLHRAKIKFVLMGTHGIGGWRTQPRATQDVDVLVARRDHAKAVRVLAENFPRLTVKDTPVVTRFMDPTIDAPVIDLMKPVFDVLKLAFRYSIRAAATHRIPDLEMALVSKFAAMVSPYREYDKKLIDGGDFVNIVKHHHPKIDIAKLKRLARRVYKRGDTEIAKMVDDIRAGRKIAF